MNKTIKKLIEQSGTDVSGKWMRLDQVEELSQLVIKECIGIIENLSPGYKDYRDQIEDAFRRDCVEEIKEHFKISPSETTLREMVYSEEYDSYYNEITNEWIEDMCSDPECLYCKDRPERPEKPLNEPV